MQPHFRAYLLVVFFSTLLYYNLHRFIFVYRKPDALLIEKYKWAAENIPLLKALIIFSIISLGITLFFVGEEILILLAPLAIISFLYSIPSFKKYQNRPGVLGFTGMKTMIIAIIWTAATVFIPVLQEVELLNTTSVAFVFAERFAFIFAIAIPFDIRDMQADALASRKTIPVLLGEKLAMLICNLALIVSLLIAVLHCISQSDVRFLPAIAVSTGLAFIFINSKKIKDFPFFYHGILDGSILILGLLITLSYYL